jgi:hypothetical protein
VCDNKATPYDNDMFVCINCFALYDENCINYTNEGVAWCANCNVIYQFFPYLQTTLHDMDTGTIRDIWEQSECTICEEKFKPKKKGYVFILPCYCTNVIK